MRVVLLVSRPFSATWLMELVLIAFGFKWFDFCSTLAALRSLLFVPAPESHTGCPIPEAVS